MATSALRRSEGLFTAQPKRPRRAHREPHHQQQELSPSPVARMKRPLNPIDDNLTDPLNKRNRIAVEICARPLSQALGPSKPIVVRRQLSTTQPTAVASTENPERPSPTTNPLPPASSISAIPPTSAPSTATDPTATTTTLITASPTQTGPPARTATSKAHGLTKHQKKAINGIRHELDRLQPHVADTSSAIGPSGRKLRSQEATRFKSELSAYFPEYDEVIGNDPPKEQQLPNVDTSIVVIDSDCGSSDPTTASIDHTHPRSTLDPPFSTVRIYSDRQFTDLSDSHIVDFSFRRKEEVTSDVYDPLPDSHYAPVHRRAERLEKSIRNTERGRAQHEKDQIIRLLGELQGHDWLRTMGVNGVTESRRKSFEPARDHFIKGCQTILEKFRAWSQEEKRRKLEKERALAERSENDPDTIQREEDDDDRAEENEEAEEEDEEEEEDVHESDTDEEAASQRDIDMLDVGDEGRGADAPEYSDVDAAARQLHMEAMERARYGTSSSPKRFRGEPPPVLLREPVPREFTSFFRKKHQRDAALNKSRRRGRTVLAWGQPVPDVDENDFELPASYLDEDTLRARERQKRRDRRQRQQARANQKV
ncbi:hypothetical protein GGS20DRAFT_528935 [Poronia punctata]|nr:hypothetical protein GGS20DRAFT_528935 [Poronia punctata]